MLTETLQSGLQALGYLEMEETIHATILNHKGKNKNRATNNTVLVKTISPLIQKWNYDWLGLLTVEKVVVVEV